MHECMPVGLRAAPDGTGERTGHMEEAGAVGVQGWGTGEGVPSFRKPKALSKFFYCESHSVMSDSL